jgi:hypothetical protein
MPSSLNGTGVTFSDGSTKNSGVPNVQTFNSTGTWTKLAGYSVAAIELAREVVSLRRETNEMKGA